MSAASTPALPFDPATVQFDPLLRRLNLANTRRPWQRLLDRAETHGWSCREFLGVLVTEEIAHRQQTRIQRSVRQDRISHPSSLIFPPKTLTMAFTNRPEFPEISRQIFWNSQ